MHTTSTTTWQVHLAQKSEHPAQRWSIQPVKQLSSTWVMPTMADTYKLGVLRRHDDGDGCGGREEEVKKERKWTRVLQVKLKLRLNLFPHRRNSATGTEIHYWQVSYAFHRPSIVVKQFTEHIYRPYNIALILFCGLWMMKRLYLKIGIYKAIWSDLQSFCSSYKVVWSDMNALKIH